MLTSIWGLLLALGVLVTVHEFGHFWVARRCGVKVLRFSVGFGHPIWRTHDKHGTEYVIAWIPLGGYVKMLDEREGEVPESLRDQAFNTKPPYQKIAIALAGPVANFIFAILAFSVLNMVGIRDLATIVNQPMVNTVAYDAGLTAKDRIDSVDGESVSSFTELNLALASRVGDTGTIVLGIDRSGQTVSVVLPISQWLASDQTPSLLGDLGLSPYIPDSAAVIGRLEQDGAAQLGGLEVGDVILSANGQTLSNWREWVDSVQKSADSPLLLLVDRDGQTVDLLVTPKRIERDGKEIGYVGAGAEAFMWPDDQLVINRFGPLQAIGKGALDTWQMVSLSCEMLWKMVTGRVSLNQIGGPISMAQMAGTSVESGFESFIGFLALISISLGIINLLPVPILDGGHVVIHSIEWIRGRELSERALGFGMQVGMVFVLSLMALAFFNDITRLF